MPSFPGPVALGRGAVVLPATTVPAECSDWRRVVIDDEVLASPVETTDALHRLWAERIPPLVVLVVEPELLKAPGSSEAAPYGLDPSFEFTIERLQYLVWSNNYDCRTGEPIWWHARRAVRHGATLVTGGDGDVLLPDGSPAWCDGGPRGPLLGAHPPDRAEQIPSPAILHREAIEFGDLTPDRIGPVDADLAPDQMEAVRHGAGPARIIAPAGSGKTRVLTERLRHLLEDRGVTPASVLAVAYNRRAADELGERTRGLPTQIRTLNSLGLAIVNGSRPFITSSEIAGPRSVIDEPDVRRILESLLTVRRQQNTDPLVPYLDALSAIRLGLVTPSVVEEAIPDATGIADVFDAYRSILTERRLVDFDEQIYLAIEILLRDPAARRHNQRHARHLLVDEFQDLTPAHLLLLRLLAAPTYDVFGVGDDDQVIYSYAGARPEFLIDYERHFPHAKPYVLHVNYRCAPAVVAAASTLLTHNRLRVDKTISPAPGRSGEPGALRVERLASPDLAAGTATQLQAWAGSGRGWDDMAVLARVNSALLAVQVTLVERGIPCTTPVTTAILGRTGIRSALAYLRIAADPDHIRRADLSETIRRPSRRIARNVAEMLVKRPTTSVSEIRRLASALSGGDVDKVDSYAGDLEKLAKVMANASTAEVLRCIREDIGLGRTMEALDSSRREADRSTHLDDLAALEQVAALHTDPETFEAWLTDVLGRSGTTTGGVGVTLSTVHRVKGREWPHVVVFGADAESFPHRLASDVEEERRIFHVAITRSSVDAVVMADISRPSPFCAEMQRAADPRPPATREALVARERRSPRIKAERPPSERAVAAFSQFDGPLAAAREEASAALRTWRTATASRDQVPAYIVFSDAYLEGIAAARPTTLSALARCRGVGPAKLEKYGDEILAVIDSLPAHASEDS